MQRLLPASLLTQNPQSFSSNAILTRCLLLVATSKGLVYKLCKAESAEADFGSSIFKKKHTRLEWVSNF